MDRFVCVIRIFSIHLVKPSSVLWPKCPKCPKCERPRLQLEGLNRPIHLSTEAGWFNHLGGTWRWILWNFIVMRWLARTHLSGVTWQSISMLLQLYVQHCPPKKCCSASKILQMPGQNPMFPTFCPNFGPKFPNHIVDNWWERERYIQKIYIHTQNVWYDQLIYEHLKFLPQFRSSFLRTSRLARGSSNAMMGACVSCRKSRLRGESLIFSCRIHRDGPQKLWFNGISWDLLEVS
jgi:hypothetical protein